MKNMSLKLILCLVLLATSSSFADSMYFKQINYFPAIAMGSWSYQAVGLPDQRLLLWNGDGVYVQSAPKAESFILLGSGYMGDPAFIALALDGHTAVLGGGYNASSMLYRFDVNAPADHGPTSDMGAVNHYHGVFLRQDLLFVDGGDFSTSQLVAIDTDADPLEYATIVSKPAGSYSCTLCLSSDGLWLYTMDGNTGELRRFNTLDLINAYDTASTVLWQSGIQIGTPGNYYTLGVSATTPTGNLIIGGSEGYGLPGGIQIVDPQTGIILESLDPSGNQAYTFSYYNSYSRDLFAYADGNVYHAFVPDPRLPLTNATEFVVLIIACLLSGLHYLRKKTSYQSQ